MRERGDVRYGDSDGVLALAHRGGAALAPENTLAAFDRSTALGLRHLETDVVTSRDGVPLCFHDQTLRRLTGRTDAVAALTARELARIRIDGEPIPTLAEALHAFPSSAFSIDLKDLRAVDAVVRLLRANPGWAPRVCVAGAWDGWLARAVAEVPGLTRALGFRGLTALIGCGRLRARTPRRMAAAPFAHVPVRLGGMPVFAGRVVPEAHRLGLRVLVWTVDDAPTMRTLLDAGVDGIISNRPDRLRDVLIERGAWTPPQLQSGPAERSRWAAAQRATTVSEPTTPRKPAATSVI